MKIIEIIYSLSSGGAERFVVDLSNEFVAKGNDVLLWGIERSGFFNGREKWAKGFENQRV